MDTQSHDLVVPPSFGDPLLSSDFPTGSDRPLSLPVDASSVARATSHIRKTDQDYGKEQNNVHGQGYSPSDRQTTTISMLPENVLLDIFCFYKDYPGGQSHLVWTWHVLVHVCQRWRQLIFASPLRLELRIFCPPRNLVGKDLSIWPALPIIVTFEPHSDLQDDNNACKIDDVVTALEHVDRVCNVWLTATGSELERISTAMQKPFPVLTHLFLALKDRNIPVLPTKFLGGSAPRLQEIYLDNIPFPALPTLLLSTSNLVKLYLWSTPPIGYISPEALVVCLATLPRLRSFEIGSISATSRPDQIHPPPLTRTVLPALTNFNFEGTSEYLEDFVSRIDIPQLDVIHISYSQIVDFQVAQVAKFIDRSVGPKLTQLTYAQIFFYSHRVTFDMKMSPHANGPYPRPSYAINCEGIDRQVLHMGQLLNHVSATLSNVVHLRLSVRFLRDGQLEGTEEVEWLHLFHLFPTVHTLYVSQELSEHVARALESITGETVAETMPSLGLIYLAKLPARSVEKFVTARRLSDRPVTVVETEAWTEWEFALEFDETFAINFNIGE